MRQRRATRNRRFDLDVPYEGALTVRCTPELDGTSDLATNMGARIAEFRWRHNDRSQD